MEKTQGEVLYDAFIAKQDINEVEEITKKVNAFLDAAFDEIKKNIDEGKEPISVISTIESKAGIIAPNKKLENLFTSFLFTTIIKREAKLRNLEVNIQPNVKQVSADAKPMMELLLICTFAV